MKGYSEMTPLTTDGQNELENTEPCHIYVF